MSARSIIALTTHKAPIWLDQGGTGGVVATVNGVVGTETADAILSALESAGYVVVPKEPTERMLKAYYDCMDKPKPPSPRNKATTMMNPNKFLQHTHKATVRYKAMLLAAKEAGE